MTISAAAGMRYTADMNKKTQPSQRAVDLAADKLLASGVRPTVQRIHEAVGGLPQKLRPMLEDWRNRLPQRMAQEDSAPPTVAAEERAEALVRRAIDSARGSLRERIRSTRKRLSTLTDKSPTKSDVVTLERKEVERLAHEFSTLHADLVSLEQRTSELVRALRRLR
jgi:Plasmid replication region DNA-binding N-term